MRHLMRSRVVPALVAACAIAALTAQTHTYYSHGTTCQPGFGVFGQTSYGEPGIGNFSTGAEARVFCPVERAEFKTNNWPATTVALGLARYIDQTNTIPFWCYMWLVENSGATYWSVKKYTCSAPSGGCFDSTTEFIGRGSLSWTDPFGHNHFFNEPTLGYSCNIPRLQGGRASWVEAFMTWTHPSS